MSAILEHANVTVSNPEAESVQPMLTLMAPASKLAPSYVSTITMSGTYGR